LNYVVDASVVLKWFLPDNDSQEAERLLLDFLRGSIALFAPDFLLIEIASGLWRRSIVRGELSASDAESIYRDLLTIPLNLRPSDSLAASAFSLALTHRHSVYDAFYCALSVEMDCDFVTADRLLVAKLGQSLPYVRHVTSIRS
jgi:predicted nucleic acid-binding protein